MSNQSPFPPPPMELKSELVQSKPLLSPDVIAKIVLEGDLKGLTQEQMVAYYTHRCRNLGLDPVTKPFDVLTLQGKKLLYANKACALQLRALHKISTTVLEEREWNGLLVFRVRAYTLDGRCHEDEGYAPISGLGGDQLGNARLKAMTKANRRAILGLCGLGEMDETEVETILGAATSAFAEARQAIVQMPAVKTDAIYVADFSAVNETNHTVDVLDKDNGVWCFQGEEPIGVAISVAGTDKPIQVEYTTVGGRRIVHNARA